MGTFSLRIATILNISRSKLNVSSRFNQVRYYTSALFIPGNYASETFAFLSPNLDFNKHFLNIVNLQRELDCRGVNIDALELKNSWDFYKYIEDNKKTIDKRREEVAFKIKKLLKKDELNDDEKIILEGLKSRGIVLREDLKIIREALWELEESIVPRLLALPNKLNDNTPIEPVIMQSVGKKREPNEINRKNHIDIGKSLKLIEYENSLNYYLCNEAALFEIGVTTWAGKLLTENEIIRVSGTDFGRSFVVEGAGLNHEDPSETFLLDNNENVANELNNKLHLMGGASVVSFLAMLTKQLINPKHIPICYYATGRQYQPISASSQLNFGLFGVGQATAVHCMALVKNIDSDEHKEQFERLINIALKLYDDLGVHYRVVIRSIRELELSESYRISFELWSSSCQNYIEVGHLSIYGDYFSKRLLIAYQTPMGRDYPAIISGTIVSIPKLLGCLLEENIEKFIIPACIRAHIPIDMENEKKM